MEYIFQTACTVTPKVSCSPQYFRAFQPGGVQLIVFQPVLATIWGVFFTFRPLSTFSFLTAIFHLKPVKRAMES